MQEASRIGHRRFDGIQALRAFAAIAVVFTHSITRISMTFPDKSGTFFVTATGAQWTVGDAGVDLFFVISGFIMVMTHHDDFARPGALLNFAKRRLMRIVPLYWIMTSVGLALLVLTHSKISSLSDASVIRWIVGSYFFIPAPSPEGTIGPILGVGWTLNFEMLFYAIFALALLAPRGVGLWFITIALTSFLAVSLAIGVNTLPFSFYSNLLLLDFLGGLWCARLIMLFRRPSNKARMVALMVAACCFIVSVRWPPAEVGIERFLIWGVPSVLTVLAVYDWNLPSNAIGRLVGCLGNASYSIYLGQVLALPAAASIMARAGSGRLPPELNVLILMSIVIGFGVFTWIALEKPVSRFMRKLDTRSSAPGIEAIPRVS